MYHWCILIIFDLGSASLLSAINTSKLRDAEISILSRKGGRTDGASNERPLFQRVLTNAHSGEIVNLYI